MTFMSLSLCRTPTSCSNRNYITQDRKLHFHGAFHTTTKPKTIALWFAFQSYSVIVMNRHTSHMLDSSTAFVLQGEKGSPGKNGAPGFIVSNSEHLKINSKSTILITLSLEDKIFTWDVFIWKNSLISHHVDFFELTLWCVFVFVCRVKLELRGREEQQERL